MKNNFKSLVNRRPGFALLALVAVGMLTVRGASSQAPAQSTRRAIRLPEDNPQAPFSGGILTGNTLYLAGRIGLDKSGKAPTEVGDEIKLVLDQIKATLEQAGMTMDNCVHRFVAVRQVQCRLSDLLHHEGSARARIHWRSFAAAGRPL